MEMRHRGGKGDVDDVGLLAEGRESSELSRSARRALKRVDVYPKMHREFKVQTEFGATGASIDRTCCSCRLRAHCRAHIAAMCVSGQCRSSLAS